MNDSLFDPESILNSTVAGRMATFRPPIPVAEYLAQIVEMKPDVIAQTDKETGIEQHVPIINFKFEIADEDLMRSLKMREFPSVNRRVYLNIDEATGELDPENNLVLGQIREACGQNTEEDGDWMIGQLLNASCLIRVTHNEKDGRTYTNISGFAEES